MKIKSSLITQAAGSLGGLTAQNSRSGIVLKGRGIPTKSTSPDAQASRGVFRFLSGRWTSGLTEAQREGWRTYSAQVLRLNKLGDQREIGAKAQFIRSNSPRMRGGAVVVDDAPANFTLDFPPTISAASAGSGAQTITLVYSTSDPWRAEDGAGLFLTLGNSHIRSRAANRFSRRFMAFIPGSSSSPPPGFLITAAPWYIQLNTKVAVFARQCRADGRLSPETRYDVFVGL